MTSPVTPGTDMPAPSSPSPSGPASASPSPVSASPWAVLGGTLVSIYGMHEVGAAWAAGRIPDWKWAILAMIACAVPGDALRVFRKFVMKKE